MSARRERIMTRSNLRGISRRFTLTKAKRATNAPQVARSPRPHRRTFDERKRGMLIRLSGGRVIDPANGRDGIGDLWIRDDRIVAPPTGETPDAVYDVSGKIVMAGAIDIHSHIAGGNVNTARLLLPENHRAHRPRPGGDASCRPPAGRPSRPAAAMPPWDLRRSSSRPSRRIMRCMRILNSPMSRSSTRAF